MSARINRDNRTISRADVSRTTSSKSPQIPYIDPHLIDHLRSVHAPHVSDQYTLRDYDEQVGKQKLIDYLASLAAQQ